MRRLLILALLPFLGLVVVPPAEALSCVGPEAVINRAEYLLTGRVTALDRNSARVDVAVDEVWRGSDVPRRLQLRDDLPGWSAWRVGATYLLAPVRAKSGTFTVNTCQAWDHPTRFSRYRPAVVREPGAVPTPLGETEDATKPLSNDDLRLRKLGAGLAAIVVLGGGIIFLRRKRGAGTSGAGYSPETRPEDY